MSDTTAPEVITPDAVFEHDGDGEPLDLAGVLGPFAAFLPPGLIDGMTSMLAAGLADAADAPALVDLAESVDALHDKLDQLAAQLERLVDVVATVADRFDGPLARVGLNIASMLRS